jgi:hypothetical protein
MPFHLSIITNPYQSSSFKGNGTTSVSSQQTAATAAAAAATNTSIIHEGVCEMLDINAFMVFAVLFMWLVVKVIILLEKYNKKGLLRGIIAYMCLSEFPFWLAINYSVETHLMHKYIQLSSDIVINYRYFFFMLCDAITDLILDLMMPT